MSTQQGSKQSSARTESGSGKMRSSDDVEAAITSVLERDDRFQKRTRLGFGLVLGALVLGAVASWLMVGDATDKAESAATTVTTLQEQLDKEQEARKVAEQKASELVQEKTEWEARVAEAVESYLADEEFAATLLGEKGLPSAVPTAQKPTPQPDPTLAYDLWKQGYLASQQGDSKLARNAFEQAVFNDPDFAPPYNSLGILLMRELHYEPAIEKFEQALVRRPSYAPAKANLGLAYMQVGRVAEAVLTCAQARMSHIIPLTRKLQEAVEGRHGVISQKPLTCTLESAGQELRDEGMYRWTRHKDPAGAIRLIKKSCEVPHPPGCKLLENYCDKPELAEACSQAGVPLKPPAPSAPGVPTVPGPEE